MIAERPSKTRYSLNMPKTMFLLSGIVILSFAGLLSAAAPGACLAGDCTNGTGSLSLTNGRICVTEFKSGLPSGFFTCFGSDKKVVDFGIYPEPGREKPDFLMLLNVTGDLLATARIDKEELGDTGSSYWNYYEEYTFKVRRGDRLRIVVQSLSFKPVLMVLLPGKNEEIRYFTGQTPMSADLRLEAEKSGGTVTVRVCNYADEATAAGFGPYHLFAARAKAPKSP